MKQARGETGTSEGSPILSITEMGKRGFLIRVRWHRTRRSEALFHAVQLPSNEPQTERESGGRSEWGLAGFFQYPKRWVQGWLASVSLKQLTEFQRPCRENQETGFERPKPYDNLLVGYLLLKAAGKMAALTQGRAHLFDSWDILIDTATMHQTVIL